MQNYSKLKDNELLFVDHTITTILRDGTVDVPLNKGSEIDMILEALATWVITSREDQVAFSIPDVKQEEMDEAEVVTPKSTGQGRKPLSRKKQIVIRKLQREGLGPSAIARLVKVCHATVYKYLDKDYVGG